MTFIEICVVRCTQFTSTALILLVILSSPGGPVWTDITDGPRVNFTESSIKNWPLVWSVFTLVCLMKFCKIVQSWAHFRPDGSDSEYANSKLIFESVCPN